MDKIAMNDFNTPFPNSQNVTNRKEILELKKEEQDKVKVNDISSEQISGFKVVFENKQGELIALKISDENYKNLQNHFNSYTNYIARDDNSIRLNGEANEFVSNWFEKISDTFFNPNSLDNKNKSDRINVTFNQKTLNESMQNLAFKNKDEFNQNANLEEKLNFFLNKDINQDGKIDDFDVKKPDLSEILIDLKNTLEGGLNAMQSIDPQKIIKKDDSEGKIKENQQDDEDLLEKAQKKGLNALSTDEQAKLKSSNPQKFEELQNKSLQDLGENLSKDLMIQINNNEAIFVDKRV